MYLDLYLALNSLSKVGATSHAYCETLWILRYQSTDVFTEFLVTSAFSLFFVLAFSSIL